MILLEITFYTFILVVLIQVIYYLFLFGKFAFLKTQTTTPKKISISVIICAKNEEENLKNFVPLLIEQEYPEFEIVLINDSSYDNTLEVMENFASKNNNITLVNVKNNEAFWASKKYALTLGIKKAKYDFLLFTDADCKPISKHWIQEMSSNFSNTKSIVLGYGAYSKIKTSLLNKLIRFETLLTAMQFFSFARIGLPFMGVGRNLAYRKSEFFNANGFINHMNIRSGDDDLFINQVADSINTTICYSNNSFTMSIPEKTYKSWIRQKRRHISTAKHYKFKHKTLLAIFYITQFLFWMFSILLLISLFKWEIVVGLILVRFIIQFIVVGKSAKKLNEYDLMVTLPLLELFLIISQLTIFMANLVSKPTHWK